MTCVLYNQEPLGLLNCMESYFKNTPPDMNLISEDHFEIPIHKEVFYQTQQMRSMIECSDSKLCCYNVSVICPISKEELKMIVQFLYNGKMFFQKESVANQVSENLADLFGFPPIHLDSNVGENMDVIIKKSNFNLSESNLIRNGKNRRKQCLDETTIKYESIDDVFIKTEVKDPYSELVSI